MSEDKFVRLFAKIGMGLMMIFLVALIGLFLAWPIKWTWNATMPYLFDFPAITWGKAWCLNFLFSCFVKGHSHVELSSKD